MRKPRIPPMLSDLLCGTLSACDGAVFGTSGPCPRCGGRASGYDTRKKQFAVLLEDDRKRTVRVEVRRFSCSICGTVWCADEPFYPGTRIGSPMVDLCITLGLTMPYTRVSMYLATAGIVVDRWSARNYVLGNRRPCPSLEVFGIRLPGSVVALSSLLATMTEEKPLNADAILAACNYPSALPPVSESASGNRPGEGGRD
ncbi:MAG: hypothetical protein ABSB80_03200 [Methanoregula sp.]|uniref:hypothetical protein n=1 Tax=Methanoregula sp. TaxID=2052170 RepID=UPI003D134CFE